MHRIDETEAMNRNLYITPAIAEGQGALLSLSWYTSVPEAETHLTLSRASGPQTEGGPSFMARVWLASRRNPAGPRSAWRAAAGNESSFRFSYAGM